MTATQNKFYSSLITGNMATKKLNLELLETEYTHYENIDKIIDRAANMFARIDTGAQAGNFDIFDCITGPEEEEAEAAICAGVVRAAEIMKEYHAKALAVKRQLFESVISLMPKTGVYYRLPTSGKYVRKISHRHGYEVFKIEAVDVLPEPKNTKP